MSRPLVVFPDALLETLAVLRSRTDLYPSATFGTYTPEPADDGGPALPYVRVSLDSASGKYPVSQSASVRVYVWGVNAAGALALAHRCRAVLLAFDGNAKVRHFRDLTDPIPSTDPDSGAPVAFFTVAARLRPETLE